MKKMLMRTWQHRYQGEPGIKFTVPDEVADELVEMDKRKFTVIGDAKKKRGKAPGKPPADKMVKAEEASKK